MRALYGLVLLLLLCIAQAQYIPREWIMTLYGVAEADLPTPAQLAAQQVELVQYHYSVQQHMAILMLRGMAQQVASVAVSGDLIPSSVSRVQTTPNAQVHHMAVPQSWSQDRVDQTNLPLNNVIQWPVGSKRGLGARVYVVDTGVAPHPDLAGRVEWSYTAFPGQYTDENGHGTHVSGSAAGTTFGLAPLATVISVRVLDSSGSGTLFALAVALSWVRDNAPAGSIINLSLAYGSYDPTIDTVIQQCQQRGITIVAAAGNSATNACYNYPSSSTGVISVAASDSNDAFAYYSNWGSCVTLISPGSAVVSLGLVGDSRSLSGTSMAAGVTSGAAALLQADANNSLSPAQLRQLLVQSATPGVILGAPSGTPNLLLNIAGPTTAPSTPPPATPRPPTPAPTTAAPNGPRSSPSGASLMQVDVLSILVFVCMFIL